jgi:hypothetical protein
MLLEVGVAHRAGLHKCRSQNEKQNILGEKFARISYEKDN